MNDFAVYRAGLIRIFCPVAGGVDKFVVNFGAPLGVKILFILALNIDICLNELIEVTLVARIEGITQRICQIFVSGGAVRIGFVAVGVDFVAPCVILPVLCV